MGGEILKQIQDESTKPSNQKYLDLWVILYTLSIELSQLT